MKKIFSSEDVSLVSFYKTLLEDNGIQTIVKNYYLTSGVGELPPQAVVPELWVIDDDQYQQAKELITVKKGASWRCQCGELIDGHFVQCWKCGRMQK